jgi:hypothetical protein
MRQNPHAMNRTRRSFSPPDHSLTLLTVDGEYTLDRAIISNHLVDHPLRAKILDDAQIRRRCMTRFSSKIISVWRVAGVQRKERSADRRQRGRLRTSRECTLGLRTSGDEGYAKQQRVYIGAGAVQRARFSFRGPDL